MRILIIEDEKKTATYLSKGLSEDGYVVDVAVDGKEGLYYIQNAQYDLVILDVMLPQLDGWAVIKEIRRAHEHLPVLFLTARDDIDDRVKGLELGADDYLVKPFSYSELLARVRALLRRGKTRQPDVLKIADLEVDLIKHKAIRGGKLLDLTPKEFALLTLLIQRQGEILSRTLISEQVWGLDFDSDSNVIDVAIRRLRIKVDDPFEKKLVHTLRGVGYVIEIRE